MALRLFAGGDKFDIGLIHGVHANAVHESAWHVAEDATNLCADVDICFPSDHNEQLKIAQGFMEKSEVQFNNCVGCIDGMPVWMSEPGGNMLKGTKIGPQTFCCGMKKKHSLNLQAMCDSKRKFMDVDIRHPAGTSDHLCFCASGILRKLETPGFLTKCHCLCGDNACVNTPFMVSPFKGVSKGCKDAFNFFQSQLRIDTECSFGMLAHRWGMLKKSDPTQHLSDKEKTCSLVICLCESHNFCIDENEMAMLPNTEQDNTSTQMDGGTNAQMKK